MNDPNGNTIVFVNDIIFKGKRNVVWRDVEEYVKQYIGLFYEVAETKDIISAMHKCYKANKNIKHNTDAKYGWYRYDTRVAIPVFCENGEVERYNIFHLEMLIRHDEDGKLY